MDLRIRECEKEKAREGERAIKSYTLTEWEGGREAREYLERRGIICAVVEATSPGPTTEQNSVSILF